MSAAKRRKPTTTETKPTGIGTTNRGAGAPGMYPGGERKSVRDAYDKQQKKGRRS